MTSPETSKIRADVLHVHQVGQPGCREPIIALHGIRGWGGRWNAIPGLAAYAPDLRGHGRSPHSGPWTIDQHVADVLQTVSALGLERIRLLGLSYGGLIAYHLSLAAPGLVTRIVLLDPAIGIDPRLARLRISAIRPVPSFTGRREAYAARAWIWALAEVLHRLLPTPGSS